MANHKHLALLKEGAAAWNDWRLRNPKESIGSFHGVDLQGIDLRGANLRGINLLGANLKKANLEGADLEKTQLYTTNLREANLCGANLRRTNLCGADLWEANLCKADLREANLMKVQFCNADLQGANLQEADLNNSNLAKAQLLGANLEQANLERASLFKSNLKGANIKGASLVGAYLMQANLLNANLSEANLGGANLSEANFQEANLSNSRLFNADFRGANLYKSDLRRSNLQRAFLDGARFEQANLQEADLGKSRALGANFTHANLTGSCIADWHIGSSTQLNHVICDYIYRTISEDYQFSGRLPVNPNKTFSPGEFTLWASVRASALETIDLTFTEGLDWPDFFSSLQEARLQNLDAEIFLQGVEERDGQYVVRLRIETDKTGDDRTILEAEIETTTKELVETKRQLHEAHGEIKALDRSLEKALRMATDQGPKYNLQGAQFAGGFAETVQGNQIGGIINNYGANADDIVRLLFSLGELSQAFPEAQQQQVQVHLQDLVTDLKQPEKCSPTKLKTRLTGLFGVLILLGGGIATATDFANNVLELSEKLNVSAEEFQPELQQIKQIYPNFDWQN